MFWYMATLTSQVSSIPEVRQSSAVVELTLSFTSRGTGDFTLNVAVPPPNDLCPDAITIIPDSGTVSSTTAMATVDSDFNALSCGPTIRGTSIAAG